ncbi:helix-turn-helix domain-containing protein [Acidimicrobiia bacterium EGI L10123]|uniref:helix-turn-helix domain-containing protein n=1 Tax=Salinilacustrithrix flava TaxID=2957203 RepID=UPI003D7C155E|nr:helix-turn-helix domain-containing protein [Acidimicrobiia bacterium EGI L10123]
MPSEEGADRDGWGDVVPFPGKHRDDEVRRDVGLRELIGEILREERHHQERTLADVAEAAAVSLQYLSEVERGRKDVSSELLGAMHEALGLDLADVLERATRRLHVRSQGGGGLRMLAA